MIMNYENEKKGHGTLALLLGIAGIVLAIVVGSFFGLYGVIPALVLSSLAIILGILSLKDTHGRSGKGGIIIGIIAVILSAFVWGLTVVIGAFLETDEIKENVPTLAAYADESWRGIVGVLLQMDKDGVDMDQLTAEMDAYSKKVASTDGGEAQTTEAAQANAS